MPSFKEMLVKSRRFWMCWQVWSRAAISLILVSVVILYTFIGNSMRRFRVILLVISAGFLIASCGSSSSTASASASLSAKDSPGQIEVFTKEVL
jgi:hypothetical protein